MEYTAVPLQKLIEQFRKMPGIGAKTAQRMAFYVLSLPREEAYELADAVKAACEKFLETYDPADEMNVWFDKIKAAAEAVGYASDMKAYKASPADYKGSVADISMFLRVAVTGKLNSPDMYAVMQVLGRGRVLARLADMTAKL